MKRPLFVHIIVRVILMAFVLNSLGPLPASAQIQLPKPGQMIEPTAAYAPALVKGLVIDPNQPLQMDFLIDPSEISNANKQEEYRKLAQYFLASLTVPEKDLWVNLSPYEKNRMVQAEFGKTQMGRDLLAQDYILKQLTASLIYPEKELGKTFWQKVYKQAQEKFGTATIPVNTFNKVWIVPDKAVVYEKSKGKNITVYITESHLKVMLEEDYIALTRHSERSEESKKKDPSVALLPQDDMHKLANQIIHQIILPAIEREVNEGKNFANLRQINNALILATWYKKRLKESILGKLYIDQNKVNGLSSPKAFIGDPGTSKLDSRLKHSGMTSDVEYIYQQYLTAFKQGVYNYIKEEPDSATGTMIPRKYFSGGYSTEFDHAQLSERLNVVDRLPDMAMNGLLQTKLDRAQISLQDETNKKGQKIDKAMKALPAEWHLVEKQLENIGQQNAFSPEEIALYGEALCQIAKKNPQAIDGIIEVKNDFIKTPEDVLYWGEEFINLGRLMGDYNLFYYKLVQEDIKNLISGFSKDDFIKYWPHIKEIAKTEHLGPALNSIFNRIIDIKEILDPQKFDLYLDAIIQTLQEIKDPVEGVRGFVTFLPEYVEDLDTYLHLKSVPEMQQWLRLLHSVSNYKQYLSLYFYQDYQNQTPQEIQEAFIKAQEENLPPLPKVLRSKLSAQEIRVLFENIQTKSFDINDDLQVDLFYEYVCLRHSLNNFYMFDSYKEYWDKVKSLRSRHVDQQDNEIESPENELPVQAILRQTILSMLDIDEDLDSSKYFEGLGFQKLQALTQDKVFQNHENKINIAITGKLSEDNLALLQEASRHSGVSFFHASTVTSEDLGDTKYHFIAKPDFLFLDGIPTRVLGPYKYIEIHYLASLGDPIFLPGVSLPHPDKEFQESLVGVKYKTMMTLAKEGVRVPQWQALIGDALYSQDFKNNLEGDYSRNFTYFSSEDENLKEKIETILKNFLDQHNLEKAVAKPNQGSGGSSVYFFNRQNLKEVAEILSIPLKEGIDFLLQEQMQPPYIHESGEDLDWNLRVFISSDEQGKAVVSDMVARVDKKGKAVNISQGANAWLLEEVSQKLGLTQQEYDQLVQEITDVSKNAFDAINKTMIKDNLLKTGENATDFMGADIMVRKENGIFKAYVIELNDYHSGAAWDLDNRLKEVGKNYFTEKLVQERIGRSVRGWVKTMIRRAKAFKESNDLEHHTVGQSMQSNVFLEEQKVFNKDENFLRAVKYFNEKVIGQDLRNVPKLSWEKLIDLFEIYRGDDNHPEYNDEERQLRLTQFPLMDKIIEKANRKFDDPVKLVREMISEYTMITERQIFTGKPGFKKVSSADPHGDHPSNGHHRFAWFLINYMLANNGYSAFYFKDEREYQRLKLNKKMLNQPIKQRALKPIDSAMLNELDSAVDRAQFSLQDQVQPDHAMESEKLYFTLPLAFGASLLSPVAQSTFDRLVQEKFVRVTEPTRAWWGVPDDRGLLRSDKVVESVSERADIKFAISHTWEVTQTDFNFIDQKFGLIERIKKLARERKDPDKPLVIIDWGCGKGIALVELKQKLEELGIKNVRLIGYSDEYYEQWQKAPEGITFILDKAENLKQYLSETSVDLIYSFFGLANFQHYENDRFSVHIESLKKLLNSNGQIISDFTRLYDPTASLGFKEFGDRDHIYVYQNNEVPGTIFSATNENNVKQDQSQISLQKEEAKPDQTMINLDEVTDISKLQVVKENELGVIFSTGIGISDKTSDIVKALYESSPAAQEVYDDAVRVLKDSRYSLNELLFQNNTFLDRNAEKILIQTFLYDWASYKTLEEKLGRKFQPRIVGGNSLAFLVAAVACGSVSFKDMLLLLKARIDIFQKAKIDPYALVVLDGVEYNQIFPFIKRGEVEVVTDSSPARISFVVRAPPEYSKEERMRLWSGFKSELIEKLGINKTSIKIIPDFTSSTHHSFYGEAVKVALKIEVDKLAIQEPQIPIVDPTQQQWHQVDANELRRIFENNLFQTSFYTSLIRNMVNQGAKGIVEIGFSGVASSWNTKIVPEIPSVSIRDLNAIQNLADQIKLISNSAQSSLHKNQGVQQGVVYYYQSNLKNGAEFYSSLSESEIDHLLKDGLTRDIVLNPQGTDVEIKYLGEWGATETPFSTIQAQFDLLSKIKALDQQRSVDKPIVIVDWGCGKGTALIGLRQQLKELGINNVVLIGYSNQYYQAWQEAPEGITFIYDIAERLIGHLKNLGHDKVDLIYSNKGLRHFLFNHQNLAKPHVIELVDVLSEQGELRVDALLESEVEFFKGKKIGYRFSRPGRHALTKSRQENLKKPIQAGVGISIDSAQISGILDDHVVDSPVVNPQEAYLESYFGSSLKGIRKKFHIHLIPTNKDTIFLSKAPLIEKYHIQDKPYITQILPFVLEDKKTGKLFFAYPSKQTSWAQKQLITYNKAKQIGLNNMVEITSIKNSRGGDDFILTRIAQAYSDDELRLMNATAEDLLLFMIFFSDDDHFIAVPETNTSAKNIVTKSVDGQAKHIIFDVKQAEQFEGLQRPLSELQRKYIANSFKKIKLDEQVIDSRIKELSLTDKEKKSLIDEKNKVMGLIKRDRVSYDKAMSVEADYPNRYKDHVIVKDNKTGKMKRLAVYNLLNLPQEIKPKVLSSLQAWHKDPNAYFPSTVSFLMDDLQNNKNYLNYPNYVAVDQEGQVEGYFGFGDKSLGIIEIHPHNRLGQKRYIGLGRELIVCAIYLAREANIEEFAFQDKSPDMKVALAHLYPKVAKMDTEFKTVFSKDQMDEIKENQQKKTDELIAQFGIFDQANQELREIIKPINSSLFFASNELMLVIQILNREGNPKPGSEASYWEENYKKYPTVTAGAAYLTGELSDQMTELVFQGIEYIALQRQSRSLGFIRDNKPSLLNQIKENLKEGKIAVREEVSLDDESALRFVLAHEIFHREYYNFVRGIKNFYFYFKNIINHLKNDRAKSPKGQDYFSRINYPVLANTPIGPEHVNEALAQMLFTVNIDASGRMLSKVDVPESKTALSPEIVMSKEKERDAVLKDHVFLQRLYETALKEANLIIDELKRNAESDVAMTAQRIHEIIEKIDFKLTMQGKYPENSNGIQTPQGRQALYRDIAAVIELILDKNAYKDEEINLLLQGAVLFNRYVRYEAEELDYSKNISDDLITGFGLKLKKENIPLEDVKKVLGYLKDYLAHRQNIYQSNLMDADKNKQLIENPEIIENMKSDEQRYSFILSVLEKIRDKYADIPLDQAMKSGTIVPPRPFEEIIQLMEKYIDAIDNKEYPKNEDQYAQMVLSRFYLVPRDLPSEREYLGTNIGIALKERAEQLSGFKREVILKIAQQIEEFAVSHKNGIKQKDIIKNKIDEMKVRQRINELWQVGYSSAYKIDQQFNTKGMFNLIQKGFNPSVIKLMLISNIFSTSKASVYKVLTGENSIKEPFDYDIDAFKEYFGRNLFYARDIRGLSGEDILQQAGVQKSVLSEAENGKRVPDIQGFSSLVRVLGVDLDQLLRPNIGLDYFRAHRVSNIDQPARISGKVDFKGFAQRLRYMLRTYGETVQSFKRRTQRKVELYLMEEGRKTDLELGVFIDYVNGLGVAPTYLVDGFESYQPFKSYNYETTRQVLGSNVRRFRLKLGLTQIALADKIGRSEANIREIELGVYLPELNGVVALAKALGVALDDLLKEGQKELTVRPVDNQSFKPKVLIYTSQLSLLFKETNLANRLLKLFRNKVLNNNEINLAEYLFLITKDERERYWSNYTVNPNEWESLKNKLIGHELAVLKNPKKNLIDKRTRVKVPGGIDLNPTNLDLQIKRDANGILLPLSQQSLENFHISGLTPVIINITPVTNLAELLNN